MLRILGKDLRISKSTTMVTRSESQIEVAHHVFDDLSEWEFVNPSDDEHEDSYSFTDNDESMLKDDDPCEIGSPCEVGSPSSDISIESPPQVQLVGALIAYDVRVDSSNDDDMEEEEEDYDDDLDDELVPNWLSDKFGRQRIRKLGKRANSRMNKSKKGPYVFNRPGCVHGKHGLGVHHNYV
ncbi:hypothetical protein RND71_000168 [Anisodus tanguticus]|uniref:Uncharacterized protein n=1 Tax=Anisodus tanguticus TaxID=243964 RepID=A0AAE1T0U4_9SOLA|nr:hypothetical protein RND71_000168 [Anisodus tanguticus]